VRNAITVNEEQNKLGFDGKLAIKSQQASSMHWFEQKVRFER